MKTVVAYTLSLALLIGGIYLFGVAMSAPALQSLIFISGILTITIAWMIPLHIIPHLERRKPRKPTPND